MLTGSIDGNWCRRGDAVNNWIREIRFMRKKNGTRMWCVCDRRIFLWFVLNEWHVACHGYGLGVKMRNDFHSKLYRAANFQMKIWKFNSIQFVWRHIVCFDFGIMEASEEDYWWRVNVFIWHLFIIINYLWKKKHQRTSQNNCNCTFHIFLEKQTHFQIIGNELLR